MQKFLSFIRKEWFPIIVLCSLAYAVWGDHGQKDIDTYTKEAVISFVVQIALTGILS
jgi:hypothetical protein